MAHAQRLTGRCDNLAAAGATAIATGLGQQQHRAHDDGSIAPVHVSAARPPEGADAPPRGAAIECERGGVSLQRVGVLSVDWLGEGVVPGPPIWLAALPDDVSEPDEPLLPMALVLPPGAGVVVDELEDDVVGVGPWSRLVQAPRETAATSANAAHVSEDTFIGKLLG